MQPLSKAAALAVAGHGPRPGLRQRADAAAGSSRVGVAKAAGSAEAVTARATAAPRPRQSCKSAREQQCSRSQHQRRRDCGNCAYVYRLSSAWR